MRLKLFVLLLLATASCKTRLNDANQAPGDGSTTRDLAMNPELPDLSIPLDQTVIPDLLPPPDLTPPHYCDGIYVFDTDNNFSFFDPKALVFHTLANLNCPVMPGNNGAYSMGVARDGTAWVEYGDGELFKVDIQTFVCSPTNFGIGQEGFTTFGMGFAANAPGSADETLFIANQDGNTPELGTISFPFLTVSSVAPLPGGAELTGTGTAELWGFFGGPTPHAGQIDKVTGVINPDFPLPQLGDTSSAGYAFGYFDNAFYIFLSPQTDTTVYKLNPVDGSLVTVLANTGREIVGAGVSTCAQ